MVMQSLRRSSNFALHCLRVDNGICAVQATQRRNYCIHATRTTTSLSKLLQEHLGCTEAKARRIIWNHSNLRKLDVARLQKAVNQLKNLGISQEDIAENPSILTALPQIIQNRGMILQEGGCLSINATTVKRYLTLVKKRISLLKLHEVIPENVNIAASFLSHIEEPPPSASSVDVAKIVSNDEATFHEVHVEVLRLFLCWKLNMTLEETDKMLKIYGRIKHKSFRLMQRNLKLLQNDLGFTVEKIKRHGYLLCTYPDNTEKTLHHFKKIAGMDVKELLNKYPKIICSPTETLIRSLQHFQDFGIPEAAIQKCPYVLTLGSENVQQRLLHLELSPEFNGFLKNPRVLNLVYYQQKAQARLSTLQDMKLNCVSLYLLSSGQERFERYIQDGADRTKGNDTVEFLSVELNSDKMRIRESLRRHPFWCHVPLSTVTDTVKFLKRQGFTNTDIVANIQVVLYSRNQLQKELALLPLHSEIKSELIFGPMIYEKLKLSKQLQLAMCLYFIEKHHHFSGDGVWSHTSAHAPHVAAVEELSDIGDHENKFSLNEPVELKC